MEDKPTQQDGNPPGPQPPGEQHQQIVESGTSAIMPWWATEATPEEVKLQRVAKIATILRDIIESKKLYRMIKDKKHVFCEGWTALGGILGVFPHVEYSRRMPPLDYVTYESRVAWKTLSGLVVASAEAMCSSKEENWRDRDEYAIRSMSQTRATSKCGRVAFSWVMVFAGYEATPAEEMDGVRDHDDKHPAKKKPAPARSATDDAAQEPPAGNGNRPATMGQVKIITDIILGIGKGGNIYLCDYEKWNIKRLVNKGLKYNEADTIIKWWHRQMKKRPEAAKDDKLYELLDQQEQKWQQTHPELYACFLKDIEERDTAAYDDPTIDCKAADEKDQPACETNKGDKHGE